MRKPLVILNAKGLLTFPGSNGDTPGKQPRRPLFDFLLDHPLYLTLADGNFTLLEISARVGRQQPEGAALIQAARHRVELQLAEELGHPNLDEPVSSIPRGGRQ